eukprot:6461080-Amphidinium_carterae.1
MSFLERSSAGMLNRGKAPNISETFIGTCRGFAAICNASDCQSRLTAPPGVLRVRASVRFPYKQPASSRVVSIMSELALASGAQLMASEVLQSLAGRCMTQTIGTGTHFTPDLDVLVAFDLWTKQQRSRCVNMEMLALISPIAGGSHSIARMTRTAMCVCARNAPLEQLRRLQQNVANCGETQFPQSSTTSPTRTHTHTSNIKREPQRLHLTQEQVQFVVIATDGTVTFAGMLLDSWGTELVTCKHHTWKARHLR